MKLEDFVATAIVTAAAIVTFITISNIPAGSAGSPESKQVSNNTYAQAVASAPVSIPQNAEQIKQTIQAKVGLPVISVADSPIDGILQVATSHGLFYSSEDGTYLIQGRMFNIDQDMRNETEVALSSMRLEGLKQFQDSMIEFTAENEKYVVDIFTDITCGYCRKLHNDMEQYNDLGITVRYLAFPRAGLNGQSYKDMVSVWCSDNQQAAMTNAKIGSKIPSQQCENDVAEQYAFGQQVGINGTPNIILPNGSVIPGYQSAKDLLKSLKNI